VKSALRRVEELADAVRRSIAGQSADAPNLEAGDSILVTRAQAEVLRMLAHGASTRALAEHRGTTVRAAESMLARLFSTLGVADDNRSNPRIEAVNLWQQGRITVR